MADVFDVIVMGAGPVGENVVDRAVRGGLSVAVIEAELAGGECSYWACVPSKALLRPVDLTGEVERAAGLTAGPIDVQAVLARRDWAVGDYDDSGQARWLESLPATYIRGRARLAGERKVDVGGRVLTARHAVVVATGSLAAIPPIPGLAEARPWTNREATGVKKVPGRLIVLGGGVVACEMSQALHALGATETTMVVRGHRLLGRCESFAATMVADALAARGIDIRFGTRIERVERTGGEVVAHLSDGTTLAADEILVAAGRRIGVDIGLETVGLPDGRPIEVDDSMRSTAHDWLYAVGDANGRALLTHMGKYQARLCGDVIAARANRRADDLPSMRDQADHYGPPQVVFTDPQVAAVGITEEEARRRGLNIRSVEYDMSGITGAYLSAENYIGRAKAVVDEDRKVLVGVTFAGPAVGEMLHSATIAITAEVPLDKLWHAVPSFPTVSEVWLRLLETYGL
ncbi:dihydrolipoyl dehydrogenase family protein [Herbidospora yilanensis]|uniref:dihydrolipoyl dehydrogenase family protein n=1 Tax=Herbidospora yilanensis TaxID=354426 RepID=UPI000781AD07|nr:NAD(P)/FAD-dependent oxidoreductase [Herbidospora yilanensis]